MIKINMSFPDSCIKCSLIVPFLSPKAKLVTYCAFTKAKIIDNNKKNIDCPLERCDLNSES